jgi:hypothetical protein
MKGIKILVTGLMSLTLLFLISAGFAQTNKSEHVVKPKKDAEFVRLIKDCSVLYLNTKRLYAEGGQEYLVSPEVQEEQLYGDDGEQYLISLSPEGVEEQDSADTTTKGREYRISRGVEVKGKGGRGVRLNIETIAGAGYIDKADIFIINDRVVKIIIIEMEQ